MQPPLPPFHLQFAYGFGLTLFAYDRVSSWPSADRAPVPERQFPAQRWDPPSHTVRWLPCSPRREFGRGSDTRRERCERTSITVALGPSCAERKRQSVARRATTDATRPGRRGAAAPGIGGRRSAGVARTRTGPPAGGGGPGWASALWRRSRRAGGGGEMRRRTVPRRAVREGDFPHANRRSLPEILSLRISPLPSLLCPAQFTSLAHPQPWCCG